MTTKKCVKCGKKITLRTECEEMGVVYHAPCFRCCMCARFLSEYDVRIREGRLFCKYHSIPFGNFQPLCKVYFNDNRTCYRLICAEDKENC